MILNLLEVLQDNIETRNIVILPIHVLHGHVCSQLGEGLQQLSEG